MMRLLPFALISAVILWSGQVLADSSSADKIDSELRTKLETAGPDETFVVWVGFTDRPERDDTPDDGLPPVNMDYAEEVWSVPGVKSRFVDELQNAVSAEASRAAIYEAADFGFVEWIREVPVGSIDNGPADPAALPAGVHHWSAWALAIVALILMGFPFAIAAFKNRRRRKARS